MVRAAAKNHPSVAIVTSPARYADVLAAVAAGGFTLDAAQGAGGRGVRAHGDVRRRGGLVDGQRAHRHLRGQRLPGVGRRHLGQGRRCCATARTPTRAPRSTSTASRPGWPRPTQLHGKEMSYNNYVDADAARRAAYDFDAAGRRDHQARQPVRHRGRRRRRRGAPQGARVRPGLGVRRRDRHQRAGVGGDGRAACAEIFTEVDRRARRTTTARSRCLAGARRTSGSWSASRWPAAASRCARSRGGLLMQQRDLVDADGDDPAHLDPGHRRRPPAPRCSPTWRSPGRPAAR